MREINEEIAVKERSLADEKDRRTAKEGELGRINDRIEIEERLSTSKEAQLDSARELLTARIAILAGAIVTKETLLLGLILSSSNPFTFASAALFLASYTAAVLAVTGAALLLKNTRDTIARLSACITCLLYTSPSPRDGLLSRMPSSA